MKETLLTAALLFVASLGGCTEASPTTSPRSKDRRASPDGLCPHGVVDDVCPKCHPRLAAVFQAKGDWCGEHGFPESFCPVCHPERGGRPNTDVSTDEAPADGTKINLRDRETISTAGIETVAATTAKSSSTVEALVRVRYDATKLALVSAPTAGVIKRLSVDVGTTVRRGALLALVDSVGVGADRSQLLTAEARLRAAEANLARELDLKAKGVSPQRDVERAQSDRDAALAAVQGARAALGVVGAAEKGAGTYTIHAPLAGVVTRRMAAVGQTLAPGGLVFEIVDASSMWADIEVPERDLPRVQAGQAVTIHFDGAPSGSRAGTIAFVAPSIDPRTRTALARVPLTNDDGTLRANLFGRAVIVVEEKTRMVAVPKGAVQLAERQAFVFVQKSDTQFEARRVTVRRTDDNTAFLNKGLAPGEHVATTGAFLLKTEILKGAIGAGCCE